MPMPAYPVSCYRSECGAAARYKIAARWSDGTTHELKTYYLTCERCIEQLLPLARAKRRACRLTVGETLDEPTVFKLQTGCRDRELTPIPDRPTPPAADL